MRLTITTFVTLDNVMQAPGGPDEDRRGGFEHGGWTFYYFGEEAGEIINNWFAQADAFLLGRRTYEIFAAYWPQVSGDPISDRLNNLPKYVASTTLDSVTWQHSTLLRGNVAEEVTGLKQQPGNELQIHGSGELAQSLMEHDLIDEYRLWIHPVVLGTGRRLFDGTPMALSLVDTKITSTGVIVAVYQPKGKPTYGSF